MKRALAMLAFCLISSTVEASSDFSGYFQLRYRYEFLDNFGVNFYGPAQKIGPAQDAFILQRLRAAMKWGLTENALFSLGIQDSRAFDLGIQDERFFASALGRPNNPYKEYTEPYDVYLHLKNIGLENLTMKIGRQSLRYGDNRIFGPGEWGNSGRYLWDAAVFSFKKGRNFLDILFGANKINDPEVLSWRHRHHFNAIGSYSHIELSQGLFLEPFMVFKFDRHESYKGEDGKGDYFPLSPGARISGELPLDFFYDLTFVLQRGTYGADTIRAYAVHALIGKGFSNSFLRPVISAEYSYATGDGDPEDGVRGTFDGVFGAKDLMYGRMNLFDWSNLEDLQLNLELSPIKSLLIKAELHQFWLASDKDGWSLNPGLYRDKSGGSGYDVGVELDVVIKWDIKELIPKRYGKMEVQTGYGHFLPGGFVERAADTKAADWCFFQVTHRFDL